MSVVQKTALHALSLPEADREAYLQGIRPDYEIAALASGMTDQQAKSFATQLDIWVRSMINIVRNTGGVAGGRAKNSSRPSRATLRPVNRGHPSPRQRPVPPAGSSRVVGSPGTKSSASCRGDPQRLRARVSSSA
jgi:hypothetical protein